MAHRHRAVWRDWVDRVTDVLEEAAELQLRNLGLAVRLHHFGDRNTGIPKISDDVVTATVPTPCPRSLVDEVVSSPAAVRVRQGGIQHPLRSAERFAQSGPLLVVGNGDRNPTVQSAELIDVSRLVQVLRRGRRSPIAVALQ
jgi:hypothetical protein